MKANIVSHRQEDFKKIILMDGISVNDINTSLSVEFNRQNVFKAGKGAGRSGSFFFFSHDKRFIIKTISENELSQILFILDPFINHL